MAIVNAASLERNLYLVAELLMLPVPVVVGLNMVDVADSHGVHVEARVLEAALGLPVVELVASKRKGIAELVDVAAALVGRPESFAPNRPVIRAKHQPVLAEIEAFLAGRSLDGYPVSWVALKLLEGDGDVARLVETSAPDVWEPIHEILGRHEDAYLDIAGGRYDWVARMVRAAVVRPRRGITVVTDRIDRVVTHPFWGLLVLLAALAALFFVTYSVAGPAASALSGAISGWFSDLLRSLLAWAPEWLSGLIVDGVVAGAGTVLSFVPILVGLLRGVGPARGRRLHGPHGLRDGPLHALDGTAREVLHAASARFRLQRTRHPGHAHHRRATSPHAHHDAHPVRTLHGPSGRVGLPRPGLFRSGGPVGGSRSWSGATWCSSDWSG